ncbi:TFIIB-type zinc ribbon-containing protein [Halostella sp. JP-L12]|uniref:DUF7117 family protein n=1 Tax=Halostella TaxID=1843185 RepID=UPI000EF834C8|nr:MULTISPECIES: TFIIB-type zinc ribbon-containing protein [Halostella]NHN48445.1 TFIIB-type zinc ribbon-containing protein [Halostella sp. JP-L12]
MEIRGERECQNCGTRWSYYDTGSVTCPDCGSMHSVGVDEERTLHTAAPVDLDLTEARERVDADPLHRVATAAKETCREYVRSRGFVHAGDLQDLDDTYLAANELLHAADLFGRSFQPTDEEEYYFLELLRSADRGERPDPVDVPDSMREARGLGVADAVKEYRSELRRWYDGEDPAAEDALEGVREHQKRLRALGGDVEPSTADALAAAIRDLARYLRDDDELALTNARDRLDRLAE